jgi:hypothetical protein
MTNHNYSDLTIAQAHGNGVTVGGGPFLLNKFTAPDLNDWLINGNNTSNWRLRKTAMWTCFSGSFPTETRSFTFPQACGIRPTEQQANSYTRKNCGLFFNGFLDQGGYGDGSSVTANVAMELDFAWVCGKEPWLGACDPTYSIRWAIQLIVNQNPTLVKAIPLGFGYGKMIYSSAFDDELMLLDGTHVKEN